MAGMNKQIVVRFPPSPTGEWHFGNVRTFVFNYLFAKKNDGKIVMRFEDTDVARNKQGADKSQLEILERLGMDFDEGPFYQSQRKDLYKKELHRIIKEGKAYEAEENSQGTGRIVRIKNPTRQIAWHDLVKGEVVISTDSFKDDKGNQDFIIARSIDDPLYHFTVVVDDFTMGITHVLRGEDHVTSTPRQIMIFEALGAPIPQFGHFPTILGENKKKLGKRNGAVPVREYLDKGYLPDALINMIALLGWNPGGEKEIFTREELIDTFSLDRVQHHPAVFTGEKLDWINKEHIKLLPQEEQDRRKREEILAQVGDKPEVHKDDLICPEKLRKGKDVSYNDVVQHLNKVIELIESLSDFTEENIKSAVWDYATFEGRGVVLWAMRFALSGREKSPDPFQIASTLGKDESLSRLRHAAKL